MLTKRNITRAILIMFAVALLGGIVGCAGQMGDKTPPTFDEIQYRALYAAQEAYNVNWGAFKGLYDSKAVDNDGKLIVDQETYDKGLKIANEYYDAWMAWMDAIIDYKKLMTPGAEMTVEQKAQLFGSISKRLLDLITPFIAKGGAK